LISELENINEEQEKGSWSK